MRSSEHARLYKVMLEAEREYTQPAYARALEAIEDFGLPETDPQVRFCKASIQHSLAELRGDLRMLRAARATYEELAKAEALPRPIAPMLRALIADCHDQEREALEDRRR